MKEAEHIKVAVKKEESSSEEESSDEESSEEEEEKTGLCFNVIYFLPIF